MNKYASRILIIAVALFLVSCKKTEQPNFVFILVDDLGWKDTGCYGSTYYETPSIDKLASRGIRFTDAYSACPVCSPTRASIMTGKYPSRLNITDWIPGDNPRNRKLLGTNDLHHLPLEETTIAEVLKDNGYKTFFAGKWHLGSTGYLPQNQGFDINIGGHHRGSPPGGYYTPYKNPEMQDGPEGEYLTDRLTNESISFIENNRQHPFLLFLSFYSVHTPIEANREFIDYYRDIKTKSGDSLKAVIAPEHTGSTLLNQVNPEYASMVAAMDKNVGRLLSKLEKEGLTDRTYIIFTSDNGGLSTLPEGRVAPTSVRPLRAGKGWCYEGGIRVPLIISGPGISPGISKTPVISTDFFPTIAGLAGAGINYDVDGKSIIPLLKGDTISRKAIFWHYPHYHSSQWSPGAAIRKNDWKLVEFFEDGNTELYNLRDDIGETKDLSEKYPEITDSLYSELRKLQSETGALFPIINTEYRK